MPCYRDQQKPQKPRRPKTAPPEGVPNYPESPSDYDAPSMTVDDIKVAIKENVAWLDKVLWAALTLTLAVSLLRFVKADHFSWIGIELETYHALIVLSILTVAHFYVTVLLLRCLRWSWQLASKEDRLRIYNQITSSAGPFIRGMVARTVRLRTWHGMWIYSMTPNDPTAWVSILTVALALMAILPFHTRPLLLVMCQVFAAIMLVGFNWVIGTNWAIALSELSTDWEKSVFFGRVRDWRSLQRVTKMGLFLPVGSAGPPWVEVPYLLGPLWWLLMRIIEVALLAVILCLMGTEWATEFFRKLRGKK